jgi:histidine phosphotransferase ChpT
LGKNIDIAVLELLSSKICHDLISPIGAINNGVEIYEDMPPEDAKEVIDLISFSAQQASAKLQAYRMAYGAGGADTSIKPEDVHKTIEAIVGAEKKIRQEWDPHAPLGPVDRPKGFAKLLVASLLLAMEALPKGGTLIVLKDGDNVAVMSRGEDAGLRPGMEDALNGAVPVEKLEPKFMHAYMTGLMARHYGFTVSVKEKKDGYIVFSLVVPT